MTAYVFKRKATAEQKKTVIDTATAGTYTFNVVKDTTARIILVGGGGGGGQVWSGHAEGSGGGSGACVQCSIKLSAGTYTITNGAGGGIHTSGGNSTLSLNGAALITAGAGSGGQDAGGAVGVGGKYSFADNVEIEEIIFASNGNNGTVGGNMGGGVGGASVYKGYGKGGDTRTGGNAGYIWVEIDETVNADKCYVIRKKQYWKKVVTEITKYWKEIATETTELAYACYVGQPFGSDTYIYFKAPLGEDLTTYASTSEYVPIDPVTSPELLVKANANSVGSLKSFNENEVITIVTMMGMNFDTVYTRYKEGDFYKTTTTTTVVEGTPDDYTYTEVETIESVVKGSPDDYDFTTDKAYVPKRKQYWKYGTEPNATVVGSPTIDNGVASGFSASNYLTLPTTFKPENNSWDMCFKIHTEATFTSNNAILGKYSTDTYYGLRLELSSNGNVYYLVSSTSGVNHIVEGIGSNVLPTNSDVYIKFSFTGSKYIGEISLDGGLTWIVDKEVVTTTPIYNWDSITTLGYFAGKKEALASASIDLTQSYIKINNELWWKGVKAIKATKEDYDFITD